MTLTRLATLRICRPSVSSPEAEVSTGCDSAEVDVVAAVPSLLVDLTARGRRFAYNAAPSTTSEGNSVISCALTMPGNLPTLMLSERPNQIPVRASRGATQQLSTTCLLGTLLL